MGQQALGAVTAPPAKQFGRAPSRIAQTAGPAGAGLSHLQRQIGNRSLGRLLASQCIQAKLSVGPSDDPYEREADRVADMLENPKPATALSVPFQSVVQKKCAGCQSSGNPTPSEPLEDRKHPREADDMAIQTKANGVVHDAGGIASTLRSASQGGKRLDPNLRSDMEQLIGADFSAVRIHTEAAATRMNGELNALAFTHGANIYFAEGKYDPSSISGRRLIAHELVHVVQQDGSSESKLIQRNGKKQQTDTKYYEFQVSVPPDYETLDQVFRLFERVAYGKEVHHEWECPSGPCKLSDYLGKTVRFLALKERVDKEATPERKKEAEERKKKFEQLQGTKKQDIIDEVDKRYHKLSGDKPGTQIKKGEEGKAKEWEQTLNEVMQEKQTLESLPPEMKQLMGSETSYKPKDYQRLLKIAEKLKAFTPEDFAAYKLLTIRATDNVDLFEKSVDMFLARKEELTKAMAEQQQKGPADKQPTLKDALDEKWKGLDESAIGTMSESDRYDLARKKTSELTAAQLKYMKEHPGETMKDFAKSATLMNTGETFGAIGKDIQEAASGDANSWARWAAGTGAGAKLSGWLMAVAGVLAVASFFTGIGEVAAIAAAAGILLGSTIALSYAESELRIKAASQAKTPEEFKRNVELAAAARTNVIVGVALIVIAAVLHFTAKALFPETMQKISTSVKNFRERIRLKGSVYDLKPQIKTEMLARKTDLVKATELAKQKAVASGEELGKLSTEQFVDKLERGDGGFLDQSKLPPEQKVNFRELLKTPEGRAGIETYRAKLVSALKTDVVQSIERLAQEYGSKIDELLKEVDAAKNHDDLGGALDKFKSVLTEEHAKNFLAGEQERITKQKIEEGGLEVEKEVLASTKDAIVKRVTARIAKQADKFKLNYADAELDAIVKRGKELGLSDQTIEDLVYTGSRTAKAKAITATDLVKQMENWVNDISKRGFPYKFTDLAEFQAFSKNLLDGLRSANLPTDDVRIQGSALRKPTADDIDTAAFVDEAIFDKLLVDRFNEKAFLKDGGRITLTGKSHSELVKLAEDIEVNPTKYNSTAKTFKNALKTGIINAHSDIIPALKVVRDFLAHKYPNLNIGSVSVLIKGGLFDVKPDLPVKGK